MSTETKAPEAINGHLHRPAAGPSRITADYGLVLSLFPGIGLLDRAFEQEGFCVVRGPDVLWGGDIRRFHPPAGRFNGVIGGPPCQAHSSFRKLAEHRGQRVSQDLIPEFVRCVEEAQPAWFLMENVPAAPDPAVDGYSVRGFKLNNRWLGEPQNRLRKFWFAVQGKTPVDLREHIRLAALEHPDWYHAVLASKAVHPDKVARRGRLPGRYYGYTNRQTVKTSLRLQGLPEDFFKDSPFTVQAQQRMIGNGVPLPMGRTVARAVRKVLEERFRPR